MEQGIRKQIKLSQAAYKNFTGKDIEEAYGFMPKEEFEERYAEFQNNRFNAGAIETAIGMVRRFNKLELIEFMKQLEEENKCVKIVKVTYSDSE